MTSPRLVHLRRLAVVAALGVLTAVAAMPAAAGSGIGGLFNLGRTNTVNRGTVLVGKTSAKLLTLKATGSGPALAISVEGGVAPMTVNSSVRVVNLNSDRLDGLDSTDFMDVKAHPDAATVEGLDAAALTAPGDIYHTIGPVGWVSEDTDSGGYVAASSNSAALSAVTAGPGAFVLSPEAPTLENGWQYGLKSMRLCFRSFTDATVTMVRLSSFTGDLAITILSTVVDNATYMTPVCLTMTIESPLAGGNVTAEVWTNFTSSFGRIHVGDALVRWVPLAPASAP